MIHAPSLLFCSVIKAIFWDNDGVLVDTERLYFIATRRVLDTVGIPLSRPQYVELFLIQAKGAWHLAAEKGIPPESIARLREERNSLYAALLEEENLVIDGVQAVLEALYPSYLMGIVTSSEKHHFEQIHRRTGLLRYFRFALTAGDCARTKPDPEPYVRAIERSGLRPEECLAIEDSERGLAAALQAGLRCIVIPSELTRGSSFRGAHRVIENIAELHRELE